MIVIKEFPLLNDLPLPADIAKQLTQHLVEPFDNDVEETNQFWIECSTTLILLEDVDIDDSFRDADISTQDLIKFVTDYPEFVLLLKGNKASYLLALAITSSDGGGCYLLAPTTNPTYPVLTLTTQIEDDLQ